MRFGGDQAVRGVRWVGGIVDFGAGGVPEAGILLHNTGRVLLLHSINRVHKIAIESEIKKNISASTCRLHTQPWQRQSVEKIGLFDLKKVSFHQKVRSLHLCT